MLSRRQFFSLLASGVAAESLLPHIDRELLAELQDDEVHLKKRYTPESKTYGSGSFGEWATDAHGLPCYHYTCNQTEDPAAVTPVESAWRAVTDQTHQVGNDRIVAAVSNYGYIQVRQDEGGPKFLNDYLPEEGIYGAGLGYLTDGREVLGTYYPGTTKEFDRTFGMGYVRKQSTGINFSIDQTIFAPFGDDPVLISEVVVTSQSPDAANLYWAEYWGCQTYPFSFDAFVQGQVNGRPDPQAVQRLRRASAARFSHRFEKLTGTEGLLESKEAHPEAPKSGGVAIQEELAASLDSTNTSTVQGPVVASASPNEIAPPPTFLASLDEGAVRLLTDASRLFGEANVLRHTGAAGPDSALVPDELLHPPGLRDITPGNGIPQQLAPNDLSATGPLSALILIKPFILQPGQSQTLRFIYGYLPRGFSASALLAKYRSLAPNLFAQSCAAWKEEGIQLALESDPWIERETSWHSYYLRSGSTYDDFFDEHIISQGQVYQYDLGFQGAARDPLQHALPLIFGGSSLAKEVLRYTLKSQRDDGSLPFAITGHGDPMPVLWQASDLDLWLLWLASEYVLGTRDAAFLNERIPAWPRTGGPTSSVAELLARAYRHLVDTIGVGKHGLLRGLNDDWNDRIYREGVPQKLAEEVLRNSESVMNAAMAAYILDRYAVMLRYSGDSAGAQDAADRAAQQRSAVRAQWAGSWFKRLWLGPTRGWLGDDRMWLDGQPWALLGGCATDEQRRQLIESIDRLLRRPSKIGAKQVSKAVDWPGFMPGEAENGGVWAALDGPLIWALAGVDPSMAWDEWRKNSRANHADIYPDVWYGIWSGPDVYCSSDSDHAGQTGYDRGLVDPEARLRPSNYRGLSWTAWPVMNMHRHAWPLYSAVKLLGVEFTADGFGLAPSIPKPQYRFQSKLLGVEKSDKGYEGWYAPMKAGSWKVNLKLPPGETAFRNLVVNGSSQQVKPQPDGTIQFSGASTPEQSLRWTLT